VDIPTPVAAMPTLETNTAHTGFRWKWLLFLGAVILLIAAAKYFDVQGLLKQALDWVGRLGPWGPAIFTAIYVAATVLLLPGSVLTLGAGAVFGLVRGTLIASVASTLAATCAFLIGRYLARPVVARRIQGSERFMAIDRAVAAEGWKVVFLTRLSPVFPFTLLNYAFGLTRVKLGHYVVASWIGMIPGTVMYVYVGSLAQAASGERTRTTGEWALYGVGLVATIAVTLFVTRIARKALNRKISS
jgi:uncharacterized membrane protein YdjX (TVP38/TMEM64 family)